MVFVCLCLACVEDCCIEVLFGEQPLGLESDLVLGRIDCLWDDCGVVINMKMKMINWTVVVLYL